MPTILAIAVLLLLLLCSVRLATGRPTTQEPLVSGKKWAMHEQDNRTCNAGSRTFTGTVNVATGKTLSFCMSGALHTIVSLRQIQGLWRAVKLRKIDPSWCG